MKTMEYKQCMYDFGGMRTTKPKAQSVVAKDHTMLGLKLWTPMLKIIESKYVGHGWGDQNYGMQKIGKPRLNISWPVFVNIVAT
jgi:hypothetical protein